jgi:hypothetical protein
VASGGGAHRLGLTATSAIAISTSVPRIIGVSTRGGISVATYAPTPAPTITGGSTLRTAAVGSLPPAREADGAGGALREDRDAAGGVGDRRRHAGRDQRRHQHQRAAAGERVHRAGQEARAEKRCRGAGVHGRNLRAPARASRSFRRRCRAMPRDAARVHSPGSRKP